MILLCFGSWGGEGYSDHGIDATMEARASRREGYKYPLQDLLIPSIISNSSNHSRHFQRTFRLQDTTPTTFKQDVSLLLQLLLRQLQLLLLQLLQRKSFLSQAQAIVVTYPVVLTSCVFTALSPSASPLSVLAFLLRPTNPPQRRQYALHTFTNTTI